MCSVLRILVETVVERLGGSGVYRTSMFQENSYRRKEELTIVGTN